MKNKLFNIAWVGYIVIAQLIQTIGIVIISWINERPWECVFVMVAFFISRKVFPRTYHLKTWSMCTVVTWTMFYIITKTLPKFSTSILIPSLVGVSIIYTLESMQIIFDKIEELKKVI